MLFYFYPNIDALRADFIDKDVIEVINDFLKHAHLKNIRVEIKKSLQKPMHTLFADNFITIKSMKPAENYAERFLFY